MIEESILPFQMEGDQGFLGRFDMLLAFEPDTPQLRPMMTPRELLLDDELNNFSLDFGIHSKESKPLSDFNQQPRQKKSKSRLSKLKDKTLRRLSRKKVEALE